MYGSWFEKTYPSENTAGAEIASASGGDLAAARASLDALVDGNELFQVRSARMRLARAQGDLETALTDAEWLASQRGRALLEWGSHYAQQALNLVDANTAWLDQAEILHALGRAEESALHLARFGQAEVIGKRQPRAALADAQRLAEAAKRARGLGPAGLPAVARQSAGPHVP